AKVIAGIEAVQLQIFLGACAPQPQGVDRSTTPAYHRRVIGDGAYALLRLPQLPRGARTVVEAHHSAAKADAIGHLGTLELPGIAEVQPGFGLLGLPAVDDRLAEQAMLITNAVAVRGQTQGRHALHEAGCQAPEAAVAQCRIRLDLTDALELDTELGHGLAGHIEQTEIAQVVHQQATDEEFQGKVIDTLGALTLDLSGRLLPAIDHVIASGQG